MIDESLVGDVNLSARDQRRDRDDHSEITRLATEIVGHGHDRAIGIADEDDLRRAIENLRVAFGHIETAKGAGV